MGLDQYAYVAAKANQNQQYWDEYDLPDNEKTVDKPREIAYWRKHPNLQGWMEQLWIRKRNAENNPVVEDASDWGSSFNGVELELTWSDLDELEQAIKNGQLPPTSGFFFGDGADDYYQEQDLAFIRNARADIFLGLRVFYNSSW